MADLVRLVAIAVKTEAVRMTDVVPTLAANAVRLAGPATLRGDYLEKNDRSGGVTGRLGKDIRGTSGGRFMTVEITVEAHGKGALYTSTLNTGSVDYDALLLGSGYATSTIGTSGTEARQYATADAVQTFTLYGWSLNKRYRLVGCVANHRMSGRAGAVVMHTFAVTGVLVSDPDDVALPAATITKVNAPILGGATTIFDGTFNFAGGLRLLSFDYDLGNTVAPLPAAGATDGHDGYEITNRAPTLSAVVRSISIATYDFIAKSRGSQVPVSLVWGTPGSGGSTPYNGQELAFPAWEFGFPEAGDANGVGTYTLAGPLADPITSRDATYYCR